MTAAAIDTEALGLENIEAMVELAAHVALLPGDDKKRALLKWPHSTQDEKTVRGWGERYPYCQFIMLTGPKHGQSVGRGESAKPYLASGICALDFDSHKDPEVESNFESKFPHAYAAVVEFGVRMNTPSGGCQYLFKDPSGALGTSQNALGINAFDTRGTSGLTVVPSPANPGRQWADDYDFANWTEVLHELPQPIVDAFSEHKQQKEAKQSEEREEREAKSKMRQSCVLRPTGDVPGSDLHRADWVLNSRGILSPDCSEEVWKDVIWAMASLGERGFEPVVRWSRNGTEFKGEADCRGRFDRANGSLKIGTLFKKCDDACLTWRDEYDREHRLGRHAVIDTSRFGVLLSSDASPLPHETSEVPKTGQGDHQEAPLACAAKPNVSGVDPDPVETDADQGRNGRPGTQVFPQSLVEGDHLVGRMARWLMRKSARPQAPWAVASALSVLAAVVGRRVAMNANEFETRVQMFTILAGGTTDGKTVTAKRAIGTLRDAGMSRLADVGKFKSEASVRTHVAEQPVSVCLVDEIGKYLGAATSKSAASHMAGIMGTLLEVFTAGEYLETASAANSKHSAPGVHWPSLNIVGTTTVGGLFECVAEGGVSDGTLNRFFVVPGKPERDVPQQKPSNDGYDELVAELKGLDEWIREKAPDMAEVTGHGALQVMPGEGVEERLLELDQIAVERKDVGRSGPVWGRLPQLVSIVALTMAATDRREVVMIGDIEWAESFVFYCLSYTASEVEFWSGTSLFGKLCDAVVRAIRKTTIEARGKNRKSGMSVRDIKRKVGFATRRGEVEDALDYLIDISRVGIRGKNRSGGDLHRLLR